MILFSKRSVKEQQFLTKILPEESPGLETIRDVMYKFSRKACDKYFNYPVESFMFAAFALSDEGQTYMQNKPFNYNDT